MRNLDEIQAFLLDMDGTIYLGEQLLPGALPFLERLHELGKTRLFLTNNSSVSAQGYAIKLKRLGISTTPEEVLTSGNATAAHLKEIGFERLYLLGTPQLERELAENGFRFSSDSPDCVVLGFDTTLTYAKLETACLLIRAGTPFIATHPDPVCPMEHGSVPDCGAMAALIETATSVKPTVVGKPNALMVEMALKRMGSSVAETAMVGDRLMTDMRMGVEAGLTTVLVLTGETKREDIPSSSIQPDYIVETIADLIPMIG